MVTVRPGVHCDPCLVPLVRALYENGFPTVASCCGHGKQPANVALADDGGPDRLCPVAERRDGPERCRARLADVQAERDDALQRLQELERKALSRPRPVG